MHTVAPAPAVRVSRQTWGHAQPIPHAPSPLPVSRLSIARSRSNEGHRSPRLHEEPQRLEAAAPPWHLQPHVLRSSRHGVLDQIVELLLVESEIAERELALKGIEEHAQRAFVPSGELGRSVERDCQRGGRRVVDVNLDDLGFGPAEGSHRVDATVTGDQSLRRALDDEWLSLAKAPERVLDRLEVTLRVLPGVRWIGMNRVERDAADR
jgi:hypothetical protein